MDNEKAGMETIIRLLTDYQEYARSGNPEELGQFGEWLRQKYAGEVEYATDDEEVNEAGLDVMASYVLGGLTNFTEYWVKLAYQDLPLLSLGDFAIIKTIEYLGNPTKKTIAAEVVMERTTCNESIKRLSKAGLLSEETDAQDRRMRRVRLTPAGEEMVRVLNQRMTALGALLMGNLDEVEKKSLIPPLQKLLNFHRYLYRNKEKQEVKELYRL